MHRLLPGLCAGLILCATPVLAAQCGEASWYGGKHHGRETASGARFDQWAMTTAHKSLPFGTKLRVTYAGRSVVVTVTDRGPYIRGRSLDLSHGAARKLGMEAAGVGKVCWEKL